MKIYPGVNDFSCSVFKSQDI